MVSKSLLDRSVKELQSKKIIKNALPKSAVGLAIAQSHLAATFNKENFPIFDNHTYVITGDGCLQEGISSEACSLAGHLKLGNLIMLYDDNAITIDGETDVSFTEDVLKRYEAYGWHTSIVAGKSN